jgi:hypothetical protein
MEDVCTWLRIVTCGKMGHDGLVWQNLMRIEACSLERSMVMMDSKGRERGQCHLM